MEDGKRLSPVALAGEQPIAQFVIDGPLPFSVFFQPIGICFFAGSTFMPSDHRGAAHRSLAPSSEMTSAECRCRTFSKFKIALVVSWNAHHSSRSVADEDIVGDPNRNQSPIDWIESIGAVQTPVLSLASSVRSKSLFEATSCR